MKRRGRKTKHNRNRREKKSSRQEREKHKKMKLERNEIELHREALRERVPPSGFVGVVLMWKLVFEVVEKF